MAIEKKAVPMREQKASERVKNFEEVPLGYSDEEAKKEAERCLQCKNPPCVKGCPVNVNIPAFIELIKAGEVKKAYDKIYDTNSMPAITGRVCPQEEQCQCDCVVGKIGEPIQIGRLERYAGDKNLERRKGDVTECVFRPNMKDAKIAVVGSGPSGLTCAAELAKKCYQVTVFEGYHKPGGVLVYGIPEFRLPKEIVSSEINFLKELGVELSMNALVGKSITVEELFEAGYSAVYLGTGAGLPNFMNIPGENLSGIYSANEFLTRVNLMKAYLFPEYDTPVKKGKNVAVIGAGNVAIDAARTAMRLGAENVYLIYRRSEDEMPARHEEIHHAKEEGIKMQLLTNPLRYIEGQNGFVKQVECIRMELGEPDATGRRSPKAVKGSEFLIDVDTVIVAIGNTPNPIIPRTTKGLVTKKHGEIHADEDGRTSIPGVFAGGDAVTGAATVITAMGAGRKAAEAIEEYLQKKFGWD